MSAAVLGQQPLQTRFVLANVVDHAGSPVLGLGSADFLIQEDGERREALEVRPANYPIAIMLDTSATARQNFMQMRKAVEAFAGRFPDRVLSLTTFGDIVLRVVRFDNEKQGAVARAAEGLFALPESDSHVMDGLIQVARDLEKLNTPFNQIVVVSAGGIDRSGRSPIDVLRPVLTARARVDVFETGSPMGREYRAPMVRRRLEGQLPPRPDANSPSRAKEAAFDLQNLMRSITARTGGRYELVFSGGGFDGALQALASELLAEVVVEYIVPEGAQPPKDLKIGVDIPGATVHGLGLAAPFAQ